MRQLTKNEYELFSKICKLSQANLLEELHQLLLQHYPKNKVFQIQGNLVAEGDIPIGLVAHMDTVFPKPPISIYYDKEENVIFSPEGLGADDRAGIFGILLTLSSGLRPTVIFTRDEERGGKGASALAEEYTPIGLKYLIELDRHGQKDCVFYDCDTRDFVKYIENFGFISEFGSYSDISFLMSPWQLCATNLSIGYENEHSYAEVLHVTYLLRTVEIVKTMLQEKNIPTFKYEEVKNGLEYCEKCNRVFFTWELLPIKTKKKTKKLYCLDCAMSSQLHWCEKCNYGFEPVGNNFKYCVSCTEEMANGNNQGKI